MASTEEIPRLELERSHPSSPNEAEEQPSAAPCDPPHPLPMASNNAGAAVEVCTTCGKEGDHLAIDCPYQDLLAQAASIRGPPPADRASPVCPVCWRHPDPSRRRWDGDSVVRVDNLPEDTSELDLYNLFAPFGILDSVSLSPPAADKEPAAGGSSRRSGVVDLDQVQDAEEAIGWLNGYDYGGRVLRVEWAVPFVPPPICETCLRHSESCVRVTNLSEGTSERDLYYNLTCPFGIINRLQLAVDEEIGGSRRQVGVVEFDQRDDAEDAVRWLNGHVYDDLVLRVEGPLKL